jgi:hypothetical protein
VSLRRNNDSITHTNTLKAKHARSAQRATTNTGLVAVKRPQPKPAYHGAPNDAATLQKSSASAVPQPIKVKKVRKARYPSELLI